MPQSNTAADAVRARNMLGRIWQAHRANGVTAYQFYVHTMRIGTENQGYADERPGVVFIGIWYRHVRHGNSEWSPSEVPLNSYTYTVVTDAPSD